MVSDKSSLLSGHRCSELITGTLLTEDTSGVYIHSFSDFGLFLKSFPCPLSPLLMHNFYFLCLYIVFSIRKVAPNTSTSTTLICPSDFLSTLHLNKTLSSPHYVPGTVPCARHTVINNIGKVLALMKCTF